jgi:sigma-B regulation protein RsbU (phosphoserine phosphatase)
LLPRETPQIPGWEFAARWQPARETSGDYYDFILTDGGQLGLVIADVADKGMAAALFMAVTRSTVRASVGHTSSPANGIAHANRLICADSTRSMFVTLFYALLDPTSGEITYVNAGHNPPLLCRANQDTLTELTRTGFPLGLIKDSSFEQRTARLDPGDLLLFYTDGVTDATDAHLQDFGTERLQRVLLEHRHASAAEVMDALGKAIHDFIGPTAPFDDIAILIVRRG